MNPSFTVRAIEWFVSGALNKYLSNLTKIAYSFADLRRYNIVINQEDYIYFPRVVWEELISNIETSRKNTSKNSIKNTVPMKLGYTKAVNLPKTSVKFNL